MAGHNTPWARLDRGFLFKGTDADEVAPSARDLLSGHRRHNEPPVERIEQHYHGQQQQQRPHLQHQVPPYQPRSSRSSELYDTRSLPPGPSRRPQRGSSTPPDTGTVLAPLAAPSSQPLSPSTQQQQQQQPRRPASPLSVRSVASALLRSPRTNHSGFSQHAAAGPDGGGNNDNNNNNGRGRSRSSHSSGRSNRRPLSAFDQLPPLVLAPMSLPPLQSPRTPGSYNNDDNDDDTSVFSANSGGGSVGDGRLVDHALAAATGPGSPTVLHALPAAKPSVRHFWRRAGKAAGSVRSTSNPHIAPATGRAFGRALTPATGGVRPSPSTPDLLVSPPAKTRSDDDDAAATFLLPKQRSLSKIHQLTGVDVGTPVHHGARGGGALMQPASTVSPTSSTSHVSSVTPILPVPPAPHKARSASTATISRSASTASRPVINVWNTSVFHSDDEEDDEAEMDAQPHKPIETGKPNHARQKSSSDTITDDDVRPPRDRHGSDPDSLVLSPAPTPVPQQQQQPQMQLQLQPQPQPQPQLQPLPPPSPRDQSQMDQRDALLFPHGPTHRPSRPKRYSDPSMSPIIEQADDRTGPPPPFVTDNVVVTGVAENLNDRSMRENGRDQSQDSSGNGNDNAKAGNDVKYDNDDYDYVDDDDDFDDGADLYHATAKALAKNSTPRKAPAGVAPPAVAAAPAPPTPPPALQRIPTIRLFPSQSQSQSQTQPQPRKGSAASDTSARWPVNPPPRPPPPPPLHDTADEDGVVVLNEHGVRHAATVDGRAVPDGPAVDGEEPLFRTIHWGSAVHSGNAHGGVDGGGSGNGNGNGSGAATATTASVAITVAAAAAANAARQNSVGSSLGAAHARMAKLSLHSRNKSNGSASERVSNSSSSRSSGLSTGFGSFSSTSVASNRLSYQLFHQQQQQQQQQQQKQFLQQEQQPQQQQQQQQQPLPPPPPPPPPPPLPPSLHTHTVTQSSFDLDDHDDGRRGQPRHRDSLRWRPALGTVMSRSLFRRHEGSGSEGGGAPGLGLNRSNSSARPLSSSSSLSFGATGAGAAATATAKPSTSAATRLSAAGQRMAQVTRKTVTAVSDASTSSARLREQEQERRREGLKARIRMIPEVVEVAETPSRENGLAM